MSAEIRETDGRTLEEELENNEHTRKIDKYQMNAKSKLKIGFLEQNP